VIPKHTPTGVERFFPEDDIIVSKTDLKGKITYANKVFLDISGFSEEEVLGQPHNIIRHPAMPKCIFKLAWDTLQSGEEIFAYVNNLCKSGDNYWVYAHMTPTFDDAGAITGYHSSRRVPERPAVEAAEALYAALLAEEQRHDDWREGMKASAHMLSGVLDEKKVEYDEFVFSL